MKDEERLRRAAGIPARILSETDSTNLRLKEAAREGSVRAPFLLLAHSQTGGRGRLGRAFLSPRGGLYMSLLLPMPKSPLPLTVFAAVAVCRAIEETASLSPRIKWVNDLFWNGKKICGILAEGLSDQAVVGIGVNLKTPENGFPGVPIAGALDCGADPIALAGCIARHLLALLSGPREAEALAFYRSRMMLTGETIRYTENGLKKNALVLGVDERGGLMVRDTDGAQAILRAGEVTVGSDQPFSSPDALENRHPQ